jgi:hypothetical protein
MRNCLGRTNGVILQQRPQGVNGKRYLTIRLLAIGSKLLARKSNSVRGEAWCFHFATLCLLGIGFGIGSPLGHPSVTQRSCKAHPSAMQGLIWISALFATAMGKQGVGVARRSAPIAGIADIARHPTPESQKRAFRGPRSSPRSERQNTTDPARTTLV